MRETIKRETNSCGQDIPEKTSGRADLTLALKGGYDRKIYAYAYSCRLHFLILLCTRYTRDII